MTTPQYPVAVVIGRWQLPHLAHYELIQSALACADRVIIVIGSALRSRNPLNPFREYERSAMIERMLTSEQSARVDFLYVQDYFDDDRWEKAVRQGVQDLTADVQGQIALVGFKKDESSQYLGKFPEWSYVNTGSTMDLDATSLRDVFFSADSVQAALDVLRPYVRPEVLDYLQSWSALATYKSRRAEHLAVKSYKEKYPGPYYLTADSVLQVNGHVLLVRRGGVMGKGQLALPGGFLDQGETLYQAALRELREETGFSLLDSTMQGAYQGSAVFDHPRRSARGRIITQAFHFKLQRDNLPQVRGADDAQEALWWPIENLADIKVELFEDHAVILDRFLGFMEADTLIPTDQDALAFDRPKG